VSYTALPTKNPGDLLTSALWNTYLQGNADSGFVRMLADTTLGVDAASIDFTSIPATFAHLIAVLYAKSAAAAATDTLSLRLNGDVGTNYFIQQLAGGGATAVASQPAAAAQGSVGVVAGSTGPAATEFGASLVIIPHYSQASNRKLWQALAGVIGSSADVRIVIGEDSTITAAINRVTFLCNGGNLKTGSRATLYGLPQ
jgi:hypothetical protein